MRVMVIHSNQLYATDNVPFPPIGTTGIIIAGIDTNGEYEVIFDDWPIVSPIDPGWFVHKSMIVFIDDGIEHNDSHFFDSVDTQLEVA